MAEGTRFKTMEDNQRRLENIMQEMKALTEQMKVDSRRRRQKELDDRILLIKIHQLDCEISWDVLDQVFAGFGGIEYLEVFSSDDDYHSKIRFRSTYSANRAFDSLNHRNIYDGCCRLELFRVTEVVSEQEIGNDALKLTFSRKSDKIESPIEDLSEEIDSTPQIVENSGVQEFPYESAKSSSSNLDKESAKTSYPQSDAEVVREDNEEPSIEVPESPRTFDRVLEVFPESGITLPHLLDDLEEMKVPCQQIIQNHTTDQVIAKNPNVLQIKFGSSKVKFYTSKAMIVDLASKELDESIDFRVTSIGCLEIPSAHQLFVEMPSRGFELFTALVDGKNALGRPMEFIAISWPYDRGKPKLVMSEDRVIDVYVDQEVALFQEPKRVVQEIESRNVRFRIISDSVLFGRGEAGIGALDVQLGSDVCYHCFESKMFAGQSIRILDFVDRRLVFDPGIANVCSELSMSKFLLSTHLNCFWMVTVNSNIRMASGLITHFDPGSFWLLLWRKNGMFYAEFYGMAESIDAYCLLVGVWVFDPGIHKWANCGLGSFISNGRKGLSCLHPSAHNSYLELLKNGLVVIKPWMLQLLFSDVENSPLVHRKIWVIACDVDLSFQRRDGLHC